MTMHQPTVPETARDIILWWTIKVKVSFAPYEDMQREQAVYLY